MMKFGDDINLLTAAERVRARIRPDGSVNTARENAFCNSLAEDLTELLADYACMCELAGKLSALLTSKRRVYDAILS